MRQAAAAWCGVQPDHARRSSRSAWSRQPAMPVCMRRRTAPILRIDDDVTFQVFLIHRCDKEYPAPV